MSETLQPQMFARVDQLPTNVQNLDPIQSDRTAGLLGRLRTSRLGQIATVVAAAVSFTSANLLVESSPAQADSGHVYRVTGTGGEGVWLHGDPGLGDQGDLIKIMPEGSSFRAGCYVNDTVIGDNPVWLHGTDGESTGWFTDAYSISRWNKNNTLQQQGLPICGNEADAPEQSEPAQEDVITSVSYDREAAVRWARAHAKDTPPYNASCTQFVSRALWAGGLPKDEHWTDQGEFGRLQKRPGTKAAWSVRHLQEYLNYRYPQTQEIVLDGERFRNNSVPEAEIGDVIIYDWENDGEVDHATVVTDIVGNHYPEVAEWSIYDGREPTPYTERGWTYSEKSNTWLQTKSPNVVAYLLDIDTTQTGQF